MRYDDWKLESPEDEMARLERWARHGRRRVNPDAEYEPEDRWEREDRRREDELIRSGDER